MNLSLDLSISNISGVGEKTAKKLARLGIETVRDMLFYFPRRYEDFTAITPIGELEKESKAFSRRASSEFQKQNTSENSLGGVFSIRGEVLSIANKKTRRRGFTVTEAIVADATGSIKVVWFNQPYLAKMLGSSSEVILSGKVNYDYFTHSLVMESPTRSNKPKIVPVYGETEGLSSFYLAKLFQAIKGAVSQVEEWLPSQLVQNSEPARPAGGVRIQKDSKTLNSLIPLKLLPLQQAILSLHQPASAAEMGEARRRMAFDELFLISLQANISRAESQKQKAESIKTDIIKLKDEIAKLPFELTGDQKRALWQIIQDIEKEVPMSRLLNGDVGSGKTIVAALAAWAVVQTGQKVLFMVPTSILANQHFETFCKLFGNILRVGILTAEKKNNNQTPRDNNQKNYNKTIEQFNNSDIIIGTQALIQPGVNFENVGLVIVDEQHRFGVKQRSALQQLSIINYQLPNNYQLENDQLNDKCSDDCLMSESRPRRRDKLINDNSELRPHFLSMTATPIPRTLHLTLFGDLDISVIREKPKDRKEIKTRLVSEFNRGKAYSFIEQQLKAGRQAFVICPLIGQSEPACPAGRFSSQNSADLFAIEKKSVEGEYDKLKLQFPKYSIEKLHGRMKAKEKDEIMARFSRNEVQMLVSTSVVEVGVDIPNATIMMIEDADRFGLAQLHQFRGRVGRGEHQSFCFLFTSSENEKTLARLQAMEDFNDGFKLAQIDLEQRGPGAVFGTEQSGLLNLRFASLADSVLIEQASHAAKEIVSEIERYPKILEKLKDFATAKHLE